MYRHAGGKTPEDAVESAKNAVAKGFTAIKTGVGLGPSRIVETPGFVDRVVSIIGAMRDAVGNDIDIAIDFHGAVPPQTYSLLIHELEHLRPMFIEEPIQCQDVEGLSQIASKTHLPIATGERVYTKWGFRELIERRAASILQPDLSHAGGIFETRLIAGMAESTFGGIDCL